VLAEMIPEWVKFVDAFLALAAAVLSSLQTFFGWAKQAEGHNTLGARYLALLNECKWLMAKYIDGLMPVEDFVKAFEDIKQHHANLTQEANIYPTSDADYRKAQAGIQNGEEDYTNKEIERFTGKST
jgi:hypothetical protein